MRAALWHWVHAALTLACIGPGGRGLDCAMARLMDAIRNAARQSLCSKLDPRELTATGADKSHPLMRVLTSMVAGHRFPGDTPRMAVTACPPCGWLRASYCRRFPGCED